MSALETAERCGPMSPRASQRLPVVHKGLAGCRGRDARVKKAPTEPSGLESELHRFGPGAQLARHHGDIVSFDFRFLGNNNTHVIR